tara:strand:+ start:433 stop:717 length:285 start_codon:yes stop_codon:yes gene_type:complete
MPKSKSHYPEIDDIREDLDSLKSNVVELTKHVQKDGKEQTKEVQKALTKQVETLQEESAKRLEGIKNHVREKPAQSIGIAFATGLVASLLLGRR